MPAYTHACTRCRHTYIKHMQVAMWKELLAQRDEHTKCFPMERCPRCKIRGRVVHDFCGDAQTQASHDTGYTFYENAPDEILRGEPERRCTKAEAARLMKEHGLVEGGAEGKLCSDDERKRRMLARFKKDEEDDVETSSRIGRMADRIDNLSHLEPVSSDKLSKPVDRLTGPGATLATRWSDLKRQAKALGLSIPPSKKRPEVERLVQEAL